MRSDDAIPSSRERCTACMTCFAWMNAVGVLVSRRLVGMVTVWANQVLAHDRLFLIAVKMQSVQSSTV